ncbi:MAG TPA: 5-formyltetrahydrofolate cyclo-ligase [Jatrophihabitans sp.]|uniref:5-formyltetrahydrofolate cyclo-ligase n=1 Tax=Jatrophihabitans sp. TaxID=1932789 RepID=UPI002EF5B332
MTDKTALRTAVAAARAARTGQEREQDRAAIRAHVLAWCRAGRIPSGSLIAAYEPLRTEPGSTELLADLAAEGYRLIVPVTLADRDLDWAAWSPPGRSESRLGVDSVAAAALVLVPAFAVDPAGHRLGRGGGSYDRALARVPAGTPVAALLYRDELMPDVPVESWDRPVTAVVTPDGWRDLAGS